MLSAEIKPKHAGGPRDRDGNPMLPDLPLRKYRVAAGYKLQELADLADMSIATLSRIERRKMGATQRQKIVLAGILKICVPTLFGAS